MLVLTRKVGTRIRIGDDIIVTLLGVHGNYYKVGIDAPKDVAVHREEVYQQILADRAAAERAANDERRARA